MLKQDDWIELSYETSLVEGGSVLYDERKIVDILHLDDSLHIAKILDGQTYEVEIQHPFLKKQKFSCDCSYFKKHKNCKHIVAFLYYLRDWKQQIKDTKDKKVHQDKKTEGRINTLSVTQIINQIDNDELIDYVKRYAKTDKKFALKLKVHFAQKIDLIDNKQKYAQILNALIKPVTQKGFGFSISETKYAMEVLAEFLDQIHDNLALAEYREAYNILEVSFKKMCYLYYYTKADKEELDPLINNYHKVFYAFYTDKKIPIDIKNEVSRLLEYMATSSYYRFRHLTHNVIYLLHCHSSQDLVSDLSRLIWSLVEDKKDDELIYVLSLAAIIEGKNISQYKEKFLARKQYIIPVVDMLIAFDFVQESSILLQGLDNPKVFNKEIANRLILVFSKTNQNSKLIKLAEKALCHTFDIKYYTIIKQKIGPEDWPIWLQSFIQTYAQKAYYQSLIIKVFLHEENWAGLMQLINNEANLATTMLYDVHLYKHQREALFLHYLDLISEYLDEHIGPTSIQYLQNIQNHLERSGMSTLWHRIITQIMVKYKHRPTLIAEWSV